MKRGTLGRWFAAIGLLALPVSVGTLAGTEVASAATTTTSATVSVNEARGGFTNGAAQTIFSTGPTFSQFNGALGTLNSATVSWNLTGTVTGSGNFGANAVLAYAGSQDTTHFDTRDGAVALAFSGSATVTGSTGSGTYSPSLLTGTVSGQSGTFPWGATIVLSGTITLTYDYTTAQDPVPTWQVPGPIQAGTDAGAATAVVNYTASASDNGSVVSQSCSPSSGSTFPLGVTTVNCTATDNVGGVGTASFTVTVVDDEPPVVTASADRAVSATSASGATVTFDAATATDNVPGPLTPTCTHASGATFPIGSTTVTCSATDTAGNTGSDTFGVTVLDTGPQLVLPADSTVEATGPTTEITYTVLDALDAVDGPLTPSCSPASGTSHPLGPVTIACSVTDSAGNESADTFTITIADSVRPGIEVPRDFTIEATGPLTAIDYEVSGSDALGPPTIVCSPPAGSTHALGAVSVSCTATDSSGNSTGRSFTITIVDSTGPALDVPGDITIEATGPDGAAADWVTAATDLVDGAVPVMCTPATGSTFAVGTSEVSCTAIDSHTNETTETFSVTVEDTTAPVLSLADVQATATGPDGAVVEFDAVGTDLVDGDIDAVCDASSGATFAVGDTTVSCTVVDTAGNETSAEFVVTVVDEGVPLLTLPADHQLEATGPDGAVADFVATATDDVDGDLEVACTPESGTTLPIGSTDVECSATDTAGHVASGGFTIVVVDTSGPEIDAPTSVTAAATGPDGAIVEFTVTAHDAVAGDVPVTCVPPSGSLFPVGATTVTCTASDGGGSPSGFATARRAPAQVDAGNETIASFVVTVTAPAAQLLPATR